MDCVYLRNIQDIHNQKEVMSCRCLFYVLST